MREILDVRRRLVYIDGIAGCIKGRTWPRADQWWLVVLIRQLYDEVLELKEELAALEAARG